MRDSELTKQQFEAILRALDDAIQKGPWGASAFLKVIGKSLHDLRENFVQRADTLKQDERKEQAVRDSRAQLHREQIKVYIVLYSFEGSNFNTWERIVANLPRQMVSRPVYSEECDAQAIIKTKSNKNNEAYLSIYINQQDILPMPSDKAPVDKLGKSLIILKDRALNLDNVDYFVHQSVQYRYVNGRLIKDQDAVE